MTTGRQYLPFWERAMVRRRAQQGFEALVDHLSDEAFDELLNPAPLPPEDDAQALALDQRRIAAEMATASQGEV